MSATSIFQVVDQGNAYTIYVKLGQSHTLQILSSDPIFPVGQKSSCQVTLAMRCPRFPYFWKLLGSWLTHPFIFIDSHGNSSAVSHRLYLVIISHEAKLLTILSQAVSNLSQYANFRIY